jgi:hypothetical protein
MQSCITIVLPSTFGSRLASPPFRSHPEMKVAGVKLCSG